MEAATATPLLLGITALSGIIGLVSFVCLIMVLIKMFQHGETTIAILSIVLCPCGGGLIAFVYGWMKSSEWDIKGLMITWTICFLLAIPLQITQVVLSASAAAQNQPQYDVPDLPIIEPGDVNFDFGDGAAQP
jgi:hypothetical protein